MRLRHLLANLALHLACLASGGVEIAAEAAAAVARGVVAGEAIDVRAVREWAARVAFDCPCSHRRTPLAAACTND